MDAQTQRGGIWRNHTIWISVLVLGSFLIALITPATPVSPELQRRFPTNPIYDREVLTLLLRALGLAFAMLSGPYLLLLVPQLVCRVYHKHWGGAYYLKWFTSIWALFSVLMHFEAWERKLSESPPGRFRPHSSQSPIALKYIFAPPYSDFAVTFARTPKIMELAAGEAQSDLRGLTAELASSAETSFQRAEIVPISPTALQSLTKESALQGARDFASNNGLSQPEYHVEITPLGTKVTIRGAKILTHQGARLNWTFLAVMYYGRSSYLGIQVGCPASNYPSEDIDAFLNSVTSNPNRQ